MIETHGHPSPAAAARAARDATMQCIRAYVKKRLVAETGERGAQAAVAHKTGFSTSAIAQVRQGKCPPGEAFCRGMAEYWGLTYQQLEDVARAANAIDGVGAGQSS